MSKIKRSPDVIWDQIDGVMTLCCTVTGEFFTMNAVGDLIWQVCDECTDAEIVDRVAEVYDEDRELLEAEVRRFVVSMAEFGLIRVG
jgi:hypothetical protein